MVTIDTYFTAFKNASLSQNKAHSLLKCHLTPMKKSLSKRTCPHTVKLSMQSRINKVTCTGTY